MKIAFIIALSISTLAFSEGAPKFGPNAKRLFLEHSYIKKAAAPDFWSLMPYYVPQQNGSACSVASVTMVLNAARVEQKLGQADRLVIQKELLEKLNDSRWGKGITLDQLGTFTEQALKAYGFAKAKVEVVHASGDAAFKKKLHDALVANEKSAKDYIISNFHQTNFTGDPEGVGHIAPIAAYDAANARALIFDPDRDWYEPYWVSEKTLLEAMNTKDSDADGKTRGFVWVKLDG